MLAIVARFASIKHSEFACIWWKTTVLFDMSRYSKWLTDQPTLPCQQMQTKPHICTQSIIFNGFMTHLHLCILTVTVSPSTQLNVDSIWRWLDFSNSIWGHPVRWSVNHLNIQFHYLWKKRRQTNHTTKNSAGRLRLQEHFKIRHYHSSTILKSGLSDSVER